MIAAGLGGHGAQHRGRSAFYERQLASAMANLLRLSGASCESRYATVRGRRFHFLVAGQGPPLLLLHGASGGGANWYRLIPALSAQYRVYAPDLPGFGFSESLEAAAPLSHQIAALLAEWLHGLALDQVDVVGTSFGGLAALRLPAHFAVRRIIAVDTVGLTPHLPLFLRLGTMPLLARFAVAPTRRGTRFLLRRVLTSTRLPREHEQALVAYLYASARNTDVRALARAFVLFGGRAGRQDVLRPAELAAIADRLLLLWGERDHFLPRKHVEQACALAGCGAPRIIPGAGHSPNWEQPQLLLREVINFLG